MVKKGETEALAIIHIYDVQEINVEEIQATGEMRILEGNQAQFKYLPLKNLFKMNLLNSKRLARMAYQENQEFLVKVGKVVGILILLMMMLTDKMGLYYLDN